MLYILTDNILQYFRKSLRITSTDFDDEIIFLTNQAIADLISSGAKLNFISSDTCIDDDPYIVSIILIYIKACFGIENPDQAFYMEHYEKKKAELLNKSAYKSEVPNV